MKLVVLVIFGYLAVSTNAAGGYALGASSSINAEAEAEASTQQAAEVPEFGDAVSKENEPKNSGSENAGLTQSESVNTEPENAGPEKSGSINLGPENAETANAGSETATSVTTRSETAVTDNVASDDAGSMKVASENAGSVNVASANAGSEAAGGEAALPAAAEPDTSLPAVKPTTVEKTLTTSATTLTNAGPELSNDSSEELMSGQVYGQTSALDIIPFPLNIILRTFGKDALKSLDVETMCDTVQLLDWKNYKKLLEIEDFAGFKDKLLNDGIITATFETMKEASTKYMNKMLATLSKSIKVEGFDNLQDSLKELLSITALNTGFQNPSANLSNNIKSYGNKVTIDKKVNKEALKSFQSNLDRLIQVLSSVKAQNSVKASSKNELSTYDKGAPAV